jgi:hypothetical protein
MRHRRLGALLIALALAACLPVKVPTAPPTTSVTVQHPIGDFGYDSTPDTVVISADYQPGVEGIAFQMTCRYETVPMLRIWGDGLVFLDTSANDHNAAPLWTGRLTSAQMQDVLIFLSTQGYLDGWTPAAADGPNPAAIFIDLGVHLKDRSIENGSGDIGWPLYGELVKRMLPGLASLRVGPDTDMRIANLNIGSRVCTTPTVPVTPDFGPTLTVLETQQPPSQLEHFIGICECVPSGRVPRDLVVQNSWQRQLGSDWVLVEAGTLAASPNQGVLGVTRNLTGRWGYYLTPADDGAVRISAEHDNRLTLQSVQGSTFYFDVLSLSFADSLNQFIPTPTLPAPYPGPSTPTPPAPLTTYP